MKNTKIIFIVLLCIFLYSTAIAEVYVNRASDGTKMPYEVRGGGLTLDRDYQNAYGALHYLDPGPPFIIECPIIIQNIYDPEGNVDTWGSLTIRSGGVGITNPFDIYISRQDEFDNGWYIDGFVNMEGSTIDPITINGEFGLHCAGPTDIGPDNINDHDISFSHVIFKENSHLGMIEISSGNTNFDHCTFLRNADSSIVNLVSAVSYVQRDWSFSMKHCTFEGNFVNYYALMRVDNFKNVVFEDNSFTNNRFYEFPQATLMDIRNCEIQSISGNTADNNTNNAIHLVSTYLTNDCYFKSSEELPIISDNIYIPDTVTLTIDSGSVIKFFQNAQIDVKGTLDVTGTVMTSWNDDEYGGDTDLDPSPAYIQYWGENNGAISVDSTGMLNMHNSTVRYAKSAVYTKGRLDIQGSNFVDNNNYALQIEPHLSGLYSISNSLFSRTTQDYSLSSGSGIFIDNQYSGGADYYFDSVISIQNERNGLYLSNTQNSPMTIEISNSNFSGNDNYGVYTSLDPGVLSIGIFNTLLCGNGMSGFYCPSIFDPHAMLDFESNVIAGNGFRADNRTGAMISGVWKGDIINNTIAYNYGDGLIAEFPHQSETYTINNVFYRNGSYGYQMYQSEQPSFSMNWFWENKDDTNELRFVDSTGTYITTVEDLQLLGGLYPTNRHHTPGFIPEQTGEIDTIAYHESIDMTLIVDEGAFTDKHLQHTLIKADTSEANWYQISRNTDDSLWILGDATEVAQSHETYLIFDYHLIGSSLMIESGRMTEVTVDKDIDGENRFIDGDNNGLAGVDIGADEFNPASGQPAPIQVLNPAEDTLLHSDDKFTLEYEVDTGISAIDIYYITQYNPTVPSTGWFLLKSNIDPSTGSCELDVPFALSTKCRFKVSDHADSSVYGISNSFKIKYPVFTLINTSGEFYPFTSPDDHWQFGNDSASMWPVSAWVDYYGIDSYTGVPYPSQFTAFNEYNAKSSDFPSWHTWVKTFGEDVCYFTNFITPIYRPSAVKKWASTKGKWGGSCFGLANTTLMAFYDRYAFELRPEVPNYLKLHDLTMTDSLRSLINSIWTYQFGQENIKHTLQNLNKTPKETLKEILKMFDSLKVSLSDRVLTLMGPHAQGVQAGVHTIVPYYAEHTSGSIWDIYVYENIDPNSIYTIEIDTTLNIWTYAPAGWSGNKGMFLEDSLDNYINGTPTINKKASQINLLATAAGYTEMYVSETDSVLITNGSDTIGQYGDSLFNSFADGIPLIPKVGGPVSPIGYYLQDDNYEIALSGITDSVHRFRIFTANNIMSYKHISEDTTATEQLRYDAPIGEFWVLNPDSVVRNHVFESIAIVPDTEFVLRLSDISILPGDSIGYSKTNSTGLKIHNIGNNKTYNIALTLAGSYLTDEFEFLNVSLPENTSHYIAPTIEDLSTHRIKIYIDSENDGTIDDSIFISGTATDIGNSDIQILPHSFVLLQNYPNPFNPNTNIRFNLSQRSDVKLEIFNLLGKRVITLVDKNLPVGEHTVTWNSLDDAGQTVASGVYLYRLTAGNYIDSKKMILLK